MENRKNLNFSGFFSQTKHARGIAEKSFLPQAIIQKVINSLEGQKDPEAKLRAFSIMIKLVLLEIHPAQACAASLSEDMEQMRGSLRVTREELGVCPAHDETCLIMKHYSNLFLHRYSEIEEAVKARKKEGSMAYRKNPENLLRSTIRVA